MEAVAAAMGAGEALIRAEDLCRCYHAGKSNQVVALEDISLEIMHNEWVVIYGPSGSGKTTLLSLLGTLDRPTKGRVLLGGRDITRFSDLELSRVRRRAIGFVFQSFHLIPGLTAWENVSYPLVPIGIGSKERCRRAAELLERLGLESRLMHTPEEMSGGEQQRVAIARALINDPQILIADEPTSNIDADAAQGLLDILRQLKGEGRTLIMSSHDPLLRSHGDRLLALKRGRLAAGGQSGPQPEGQP